MERLHRYRVDHSIGTSGLVDTSIERVMQLPLYLVALALWAVSGTIFGVIAGVTLLIMTLLSQCVQNSNVVVLWFWRLCLPLSALQLVLYDMGKWLVEVAVRTLDEIDKNEFMRTVSFVLAVVINVLLVLSYGVLTPTVDIPIDDREAIRSDVTRDAGAVVTGDAIFGLGILQTVVCTMSALLHLANYTWLAVTKRYACV